MNSDFIESARVAPEWAGFPGLPADLFAFGMPLGRWLMKSERKSVTLEAVSVRQLLEKHWHRLNLEELLRLSGITPLSNRHTEYSPECMRELDENLEAVNLHVSRCRRIANYLGQGVEEYEWKPLSARGAARQLHGSLKDGAINLSRKAAQPVQ
jgi:hypothetical protein